MTALDVVSDVPGIEVGRAELLHQDALHRLSELVKTDSVDIAPADALITYFEQHLTAACHRTWIHPGRAVSPGKRERGSHSCRRGSCYSQGATRTLPPINKAASHSRRKAPSGTAITAAALIGSVDPSRYRIWPVTESARRRSARTGVDRRRCARLSAAAPRAARPVEIGEAPTA